MRGGSTCFKELQVMTPSAWARFEIVMSATKEFKTRGLRETWPTFKIFLKGVWLLSSGIPNAVAHIPHENIRSSFRLGAKSMIR